MIKTEVKETIGCTRKLGVEVERERLDSEFAATLSRLKKDIQIPGFRKGRAPEGLIIRKFGPAVREESVRDLIPKIIREVIEEQELKPVGEPQVSDLEFNDDGPLTFTVAIEEVPAIDLDGFSGLEVTKTVYKVGDDEVADTMERYRQMRAEHADVDREAKEGDILHVNLRKLDGTGVPIIGEKTENVALPLDRERLPAPEILDQIAGMKNGDTKAIRFTPTGGDANQTADEESYQVEALRVEEVKVPALDDDFAKELGYDDLGDFQAKTREYLEQRASDEADNRLRGSVMEEFVRQSPFEVPNSMVERIMLSEIEKIRQRYPDESFGDEELMDRMRPDSVRAVQTYLVIEAIQEQQGIEVAKEEIQERLEAMAGQYGMNVRDLRRRLIKDGRFEDIRTDLAREKAYNWIFETVAITEEQAEREQPKSNIITPG